MQVYAKTKTLPHKHDVVLKMYCLLLLHFCFILTSLPLRFAYAHGLLKKFALLHKPLRTTMQERIPVCHSLRPLSLRKTFVCVLMLLFHLPKLRI